jgi:hypothetical protein
MGSHWSFRFAPANAAGTGILTMLQAASSQASEADVGADEDEATHGFVHA